MAKYIEGNLSGAGRKLGIVVARFNSFISEKLLEGAIDALVRSGVDSKDIEVARVPGAFEIPLVTQRMARSGKYDAVICLGAVIRGATPHFDFVAGEVAKGAAQVMLDVGSAGAVRGADHGNHRAGHRAGRLQGRQQRLRGGGGRPGDDQFAGRPEVAATISPLPAASGPERMGLRRKSREMALQFLFSHDFTGAANAPAELEQELDAVLRLFRDRGKVPALCPGVDPRHLCTPGGDRPGVGRSFP